MAPNASALTRRPATRGGEVDRMGRQAAELKGLIGTDVLELKRRVRSTFDLGRQIAKHPLVAAAAVVVGALAVTWIVRSLTRHVPRPRREGSRRRARP
jgi:hypothetical protein